MEAKLFQLFQLISTFFELYINIFTLWTLFKKKFLQETEGSSTQVNMNKIGENIHKKKISNKKANAERQEDSS